MVLPTSVFCLAVDDINFAAIPFSLLERQRPQGQSGDSVIQIPMPYLSTRGKKSSCTSAVPTRLPPVVLQVYGGQSYTSALQLIDSLQPHVQVLQCVTSCRFPQTTRDVPSSSLSLLSVEHSLREDNLPILLMLYTSHRCCAFCSSDCFHLTLQKCCAPLRTIRGDTVFH